MVSFRAVVDVDGAITIPAEYLTALGIADGDEVVLRLEDGQLSLFSIDTAILRAQAMVTQYVDPDRSLTDELIADRRAEAAKE